jgi:hypothetical protein
MELSYEHKCQCLQEWMHTGPMFYNPPEPEDDDDDDEGEPAF